MITVNDLRGNTQSILPCTEEDVVVHFNRILDQVRDTQTEVFQQRMYQAVTEKTAFKITNDCFLYYLRKKNPRLAEGVAIYSGNVPVLMLSLFAGVFTQYDPKMIRINFNLHKGKKVHEYRTILTWASIRKQGLGPYPLVVRVDQFKEHILNIYKNIGVEL